MVIPVCTTFKLTPDGGIECVGSTTGGPQSVTVLKNGAVRPQRGKREAAAFDKIMKEAALVKGEDNHHQKWMLECPLDEYCVTQSIKLPIPAPADGWVFSRCTTRDSSNGLLMDYTFSRVKEECDISTTVLWLWALGALVGWLTWTAFVVWLTLRIFLP